jgi:hypothetical protein
MKQKAEVKKKYNLVCKDCKTELFKIFVDDKVRDLFIVCKCGKTTMSVEASGEWERGIHD